ncbi:MAG: DUF4129 domain-containing protein [Deltaproteobacteria bacterium]|nr:DUF4129 domain-containing protein [Deltaproteobacteria bacterium]
MAVETEKGGTTPGAPRGKGPLEILEEAAALLRTTPARDLVTCYLGSVPFVLGLLFFWGYMSSSPFAYTHCAAASLCLTLLFFWMKGWQAVFMRRLTGRLLGKRHARTDPARLMAVQIPVQSASFLVIPIAALAVVPLGWTFAFFQNVSALDEGENDGLRESLKTAGRLAAMWPAQNHLALAALALFSLFVFLNLGVATYLLPWMLKALLGIETVFARSGQHYLNTTFVAAIAGMTYLCVDPFVRAVYVLRCFYGKSVRTGEDLREGFRGTAPAGGRIAAAVLVTLFIVGASAGAGAGAAPRVPPAELDGALSEVIEQPEYTWRLPRERPPDDGSDKGIFRRFFDQAAALMRSAWSAVVRGIERVLDWVFRQLFRWALERQGGTDVSGWPSYVKWLLGALLGAVCLCLAVFIARMWRARRRKASETAPEVAAPTPDLLSEDTRPETLPRDRWLELADDLLRRKEYRLALRAVYLATLAHLGQREIIFLARFKTNREYERELRRHASSRPNLVAAFAENVSAFDRSWYGMHEVSPVVFERFRENSRQVIDGA